MLKLGFEKGLKGLRGNVLRTRLSYTNVKPLHNLRLPASSATVCVLLQCSSTANLNHVVYTFELSLLAIEAEELIRQPQPVVGLFYPNILLRLSAVLGIKADLTQ